MRNNMIKTVAGYVWKGCKTIVPIIGAVGLVGFASDKTRANYDEEYEEYQAWFDNDSDGVVSYRDAVKAVSQSGMASYYKKETIPHIKKNGSSALYAGIIAVAESDMSSCYKSETIIGMCDEN